MANKGNYSGGPPKYLNDFSKALASEVRILLDEVGKLRDERRALQFEIAELMAVKSKHGGGGDFAPDWLQKREPTPPPVEPPPPDAAEELAPARPAWRTVHKRAERKPKAKALPAPPSPAPAPPPPVPPPNLPAWAQWRPNPVYSPQPQAAPSGGPLPSSPAPTSGRGLFGPPTPPPA